MNLAAPACLNQEDCIEVLQYVTRFASPEAAESLQNPAILRTVLLSGDVRLMMSVCMAQTTAWYDCVTDASDLASMEKCDKRHPAPE